MALFFSGHIKNALRWTGHSRAPSIKYTLLPRHVAFPSLLSGIFSKFPLLKSSSWPILHRTLLSALPLSSCYFVLILFTAFILPRNAATKAGTVSLWFTTVTHYLRLWLGSIRHSIFLFYVNNVFTAKEEILTYVPGVMLNGLNAWYIILTRIPCYPEKWPVYKWQRLHY